MIPANLMNRFLAFVIFTGTLLPFLAVILAVTGAVIQDGQPEVSRALTHAAVLLILPSGITVLAILVLSQVEKSVPESQRPGWLILIFLFGPLAAPFFVYKYVLKPALQPPDPSKPPVSSDAEASPDPSRPDTHDPSPSPDSN